MNIHTSLQHNGLESFMDDYDINDTYVSIHSIQNPNRPPKPTGWRLSEYRII